MKNNNLLHDASLLEVARTCLLKLGDFLPWAPEVFLARFPVWETAQERPLAPRVEVSLISGIIHDEWLNLAKKTFSLGVKIKTNKNCDFILGSVRTTMNNNSENASNVFVHQLFWFFCPAGHNNCDAIVFEKLRFLSTLKLKEAFSNSSGLKSIFEKLHFCDGLVWTVGLF